MESADARKTALINWLSTTVSWQQHSLQPMQNDASLRRYFRIQTQKETLVAMDAIPPQENCHAYIAIANALRNQGLRTPDIIAADLEQGFLLISDFGDTTYLKALNAENADELYLKALKALAILKDCNRVEGKNISAFDKTWMQNEWLWHKEWFLNKLLGLELNAIEKELDACYSCVIEMAITQPQVFMHRDYHSANLMVLPNEVGVLDFQDAFIGPITYDLVSLLRDCYVNWPEQRVQQWVLAYWQILTERGQLTVDASVFFRWFDWMGVQRHLKALFTFARKCVRDQQDKYLKHIPRTLNYLLQVTERYAELAIMHTYLHTTVQPAFNRVISSCAR